MTSWPGFEEEEKIRMLLSQATLTGILMTMLSGILRTALSSICLRTCIFGVEPSVLSDKLNFLATWRCQHQPNYHGSHEVDTGTESGKQDNHDHMVSKDYDEKRRHLKYNSYLLKMLDS